MVGAMATEDDARELALSLPATIEKPSSLPLTTPEHTALDPWSPGAAPTDPGRRAWSRSGR